MNSNGQDLTSKRRFQSGIQKLPQISQPTTTRNQKNLRSKSQLLNKMPQQGYYLIDQQTELVQYRASLISLESSNQQSVHRTLWPQLIALHKHSTSIIYKKNVISLRNINLQLQYLERTQLIDQNSITDAIQSVQRSNESPVKTYEEIIFPECKDFLQENPLEDQSLIEMVVDDEIQFPNGDKFTFKDFDSLLPTQFDRFKIKKLTWDNFKGKPDSNSRWKAHTFWCVGYTFDIQMRKLKKSNTIRYRLAIHPWTALTNCCWVKIKWERLLEHETGHYLIGCAVNNDQQLAIQRAEKQKFTRNYRMEAQKLFANTVQEYINMEKIYDQETDHSRNIKKQKEWNSFIYKQIQEFQAFDKIKKASITNFK